MKNDKKWALITGASSGLGIDFARQLAAKNYNIILTARTEDALDILSKSLRENHNVEVICIPLDLSCVGSAEILAQKLDEQNINVDTLINNAGFGLSESILDHDPKRLRAMLQLNVISLSELCQVFGQKMAKNGSGNILLVASMASFFPAPLFAAYAASKAYIVSLGEALNVELADKKINVTVVSPGLMNTGFNNSSGFSTPDNMQKMVLSTEKVASIGLKALFAKKSGIIAGRMNSVLAFSTRLFSRHASAKQMYKQEIAKK